MSDYPAVLYVEDDPRSRRVIEMALKRELGLTNVALFEDSTNFVDNVSNLTPKPDVIFLDIHVKPYDGFQMLQILRGMPQFDGVPIVALTASVMNEEVQRLQAAGFSSIIAKPVDLDSFPDVLQRILDGEAIWRINN
jgi:CheY-like chemotaxis protein